MQINEKVYRSAFKTQQAFENYSEEMQAYCIANGLELTCGTDEKGQYWQIIEHTPVPIEDLRSIKIAELKNARDREEQTPIAYGGYRWDIDDKSLQRINGAIIALGDNSIVWTSADNTEIRGVTANDLRGVISASAMRSNELHVKYRELRERVEQAKTKEQVEAIKW